MFLSRTWYQKKERKSLFVIVLERGNGRKCDQFHCFVIVHSLIMCIMLSTYGSIKNSMNSDNNNQICMRIASFYCNVSGIL